MNKPTMLLLFAIVTLTMATQTIRAQEPVDKQTIVTLKKERNTIYSLLNNLSANTGIYFVYDSDVIDNNYKMRIPGGSYTLEEAIRVITGNPSILLKIEGSHALLYMAGQQSSTNTISDSSSIIKSSADTSSARHSLPPKIQDNLQLAIRGRITDKITREPLSYAAVTIEGLSAGVLTNNDGQFLLRLNDSLASSQIRLSHLGYQSRIFPVALLLTGHFEFMLEPMIIPLQEVVVRVTDPVKIIAQMRSSRSGNYPASPAYLTTFYREGTEYRKSLRLTEAVLGVYKPGVTVRSTGDQVRVLKMRKITDPGQSDTLVAKLKSSISSALMLDIAKNLPDFLMTSGLDYYNYTHTDITTLDQRRVYVISFSQKEDVTAPLYSGKLYIDAQNHALVEARFEITPQYIKAAKNDLVIKESRSLEITPESVSYKVSYKPFNGKYHISHVKGELRFKVRRSRAITGSTLNVWFEMATCKIEEDGASPFERYQRLNPNQIFSETSYRYDPLFWSNFNIILPEEKIIDIIENYNFNM
ncbi:MAG: carboxypeptidase-like regulatory domain-containing protein [Bacteroidia bacterium]|nr:carboxypeptidase-like regulatory domain-containing protein [Bacteroidia bacterium]